MNAHVVHIACDIAAPVATLILGLLVGEERGFCRAWMSRSVPPVGAETTND